MAQGFKPIFGCIADDFTGAGDAASFLCKGGMSTVLYNGTPKEDINLHTTGCAIVIALKTRTAEKEDAVRESVAACRWLKKQGIEQIYFKYCSTFDSTKAGNIGPVLDALLEETGAKRSILCPALPVNQRVVREGKLYVDGVPLDESVMKNHPLTPMWDCDIEKLMQPQGKYECCKLSKKEMDEWGEGAIKKLAAFGEGREKYYVIPDYENAEDGTRIAQIFGEDKMLSGGSGILQPLAERFMKEKHEKQHSHDAIEGRTILLAGSCSQMTLKQIVAFEAGGGYCYRVTPQRVMKGEETPEHIWDVVSKTKEQAALIYCSEQAEKVMENQRQGKEKVAKALEDTMATLARKALADGYNKFIVAGGETSGAVIQKLQFNGFYIGNNVSEGIPVLTPIENSKIRIVLKSGNFGTEDFFVQALKATGGISP